MMINKVRRSELSNARMVAGNETKYSKVVVGSILKEWVGIGWVDLRKATAKDKAKYPVALEGNTNE